MSEIKLNLTDSQRIIHGTIHGSIADTTVAALSAEPETIAELEAALARYIKPTSQAAHSHGFTKAQRSIRNPGMLALSSSILPHVSSLLSRLTLNLGPQGQVRFPRWCKCDRHYSAVSDT